MSDENTESTGNVTGAAAAETPIIESSAPPSWFDSLPDDIKKEPSIQNFKGKDVVDVVKSHISAQKELGSRIRIPGPDASPEAKQDFLSKLDKVEGVTRLPDPNDKASVDAFFSKLGRPESPDGYKFELPQGVEANPAILGEFKSLAHNLGLNNQQADALVKFEIEREQRVATAMQAQAVESKNILNEVWGKEFDTRQKLGKSVVEHFGTKYPEAAKELLTTAVGNNPILLMMAAELGKAYKETGVIKGDSAVADGFTPEEAKARIAEINANPNHPANPLFRGQISEKVRQAALAEKAKLFEAANPKRST